MRRLMRRLRTRTAAFVHDLCMIPVAWLGAYWLRFNLGDVPGLYWDTAISLLPLVIAVNGAVFWYFGLYRGIWRFASMPDLVRITKAVIAGVLISAVAIFMVSRMQTVPRSVLPLQALLLILALGGPRLAYRWTRDRALYAGGAQSVLIVGAGDAGEGLARELLRDPALRMRPIGFVDDDPAKKGLEIRGLRVLAKTGKLPRVVREKRAELVLLAMPSATSEQIRRVVEFCEDAKVPFRTVPLLGDLLEGKANLSDLREVSIEDLLGRDSVSLDWASIRNGVADKTVLVTGGAGSIGSELCRQIAEIGPAELVIFDQSEFGLYSIEQELAAKHPQLKLTVCLGDAVDQRNVERTMATVRPAVVFHAAAYKHVPMLEAQMREAIRNNVQGARNVARAAVTQQVETVVLISTDKAVNPTNVMGASKRIAEVYCQNADRQHPQTRFITVRFGNVLGSAGSVVPLFERQIRAGGPVTVTHPDMKRYFMTIPEACQLIMEAGAIGRGGEIFVLDMGEPVEISYLAEQMITLAGKRVGADVEIVYTGLRPGEKLVEELFHERENLAPTGREKLLLAQTRTVDWDWLNRQLDDLMSACERYDEGEVKRLVSDLVPEYVNLADETGNVIPLESARR